MSIISTAWLFRIAVLMLFVACAILGWATVLVIRVYEIKLQMRGNRR